MPGRGNAGLERQRDPRDLAARGDFLEWARLLAKVGRNRKPRRVDSGLAPRRRAEIDLEPRSLHRQARQLRLDARLEFARGLFPPGGERSGCRLETRRQPFPLALQIGPPFARGLDGLNLTAHPLEKRQNLFGGGAVLAPQPFERGQARLDLLQARRVGLQVREVVADGE